MRKVMAAGVMGLFGAVTAAWAQQLPPSSPLGDWLQFHMDGIHLVGKIGVSVVILAALMGLYLFFRKPPEEKRHYLRWIHVGLALSGGLTVLTHAVAFDTTHYLTDPHVQMLRSGTWLGLTILFLLITGGLRFWSWHHHGLWRWSHRTAQVLFLVAVCVHVIPKLGS